MARATAAAARDDPFRLVFYRGDLKLVTMWAPGTPFRGGLGGSTAIDLPEVEDLPPQQRKIINVPGRRTRFPPMGP